MVEEAHKVNASTIMSYINAPLMVGFDGMKEIIAKFIISQYHNGNFYFDKPVEIFGEVIYTITWLSNKGEPVPISSKSSLVEKLTSTPTGKNSKVLVIS